LVILYYSTALSNASSFLPPPTPLLLPTHPPGANPQARANRRPPHPPSVPPTHRVQTPKPGQTGGKPSGVRPGLAPSQGRPSHQPPAPALPPTPYPHPPTNPTTCTLFSQDTLALFEIVETSSFSHLTALTRKTRGTDQFSPHTPPTCFTLGDSSTKQRLGI